MNDSVRYERWLEYIKDECAKDSAFKKEIVDGYSKLGLSASAYVLYWDMGFLRKFRTLEGMRKNLLAMAKTSLITISIFRNVAVQTLAKEQMELYKVKNRRYGNSFAECYAIDGKAYAFGHLQEKINRICALLRLHEEAKEEPIVDSFMDLFGYCVLTLCELDKSEDDALQNIKD